MNTEMYLQELKRRLVLIDENEVSNIIYEYRTYINHKLDEGETEESVLKSIGNVNELAREVLKSYKISNRYIKLFIGKEKIIDELNEATSKLVEKSSNLFTKLEDSVKDTVKDVKNYVNRQRNKNTHDDNE